MGLERGDLKDVSNLITQFFTCFIPFEWDHSIDFPSAQCFQHINNR